LLHHSRNSIRALSLNTPNPALVTQREAQRLPRLALWLFCAAYVIPGVFGREPWKSADINAFGAMMSIAEGRGSWFKPTIGGVVVDDAVFPYWLGAAFIHLLQPFASPELAARIPFALLLGLVLMLTWYAAFHLARTEAAQPLPLAFGGEANVVDYARAIADAALLASIACLGLLQLGHETTPELAQLAGTALFVYGLAASPYQTTRARVAVLVALPVLAASGAPAIAISFAVVGTVVCHRSSYEAARRFVPWVIAAGVLGVVSATLIDAWAWRIGRYRSPQDALSVLRLLIWFSWPAWPLALWTLWRWRDHLLHRHISVPLSCLLVALVACVLMGGSDRALLLGLPPVAVLAAFALPTLRRSLAAAIDWFSVFFFSSTALVIWVMYVAMQTGVPAKPAANVARLLPGYVASFSLPALGLAIVATLAWAWLVKWRTGRHRQALWKSMVLPASGVALSWLLLMTLWLPLLDYARSYRPLLQRIARHVPANACISAPGMPRSQIVALEYLARYRVDARTPAEQTTCEYLLIVEQAKAPRAVPAGWQLVARERRPSDREELTAIYRRTRTAR
jgi:4-amino-4-deoxy-L-arabinose transferase-like glycosyltransferase